MSVAFTSFPGVPDSVGAARRFVTGAIRLFPGAGAVEEVVERAELIVSELATNAIRHTRSGDPGGSFGICVRVDDQGVWTEVRTRPPRRWSSVPHVVKPDDPFRENGRGLFLVDRLSTRWGCLSSGEEGVFFLLRWTDSRSSSP